MKAFFYDTWAFVALTNTGDPYHTASVEADRELEQRGYAAVSTDYVLDEALTLLHVCAGARVAIAFVDLIEARVAGADLMLVQISSERRARSIQVFRKLAPLEPKLSFTDCTSFAVMRELGIELAFTADRHFHRAGGAIRPLFERRGKRLNALLPPS